MIVANRAIFSALLFLFSFLFVSTIPSYAQDPDPGDSEWKVWLCR